MIKSSEEVIIYESPDGGKTVYSRKSGSLARKLHWEDPEHKRTQEALNRWANLKEAVLLADTNVTLNDAIEKVEALYILIRGSKNV
jgi:hypothetical protein